MCYKTRPLLHLKKIIYKYNPHIKLLVLSNNNVDELYLQKIAKQNNIQSIITYGDTKKSNYFIKNIKKINNITSKITYVTPKKTINIEAFTILKHEILNLQIPLTYFLNKSQQT